MAIDYWSRGVEAVIAVARPQWSVRMSPGRGEPYRHVLADLRERIRTGILAPGTRVTAKDVAEALGHSPTPVRQTAEAAQEEHLPEGFGKP